MTRIDPNYRKLPGNYLFSEVERRVTAYSEAHPQAELIRLGIGDVTRPLIPAVAEAMEKAVKEMGRAETFRGYGPEQGYAFLREAIAEGDYRTRGVDLSPDEIFLSDGAKSDCGNVGDLFDRTCTAAVCDPVYPAYVETNVMAGRAGEYDPQTGRWSKLCYLTCLEKNGFLPDLPEEGAADLIYLCFPNNPTGASADRAELSRWVDYANRNGSVIFFDSAYEAFITRPDIPHSIFEIEGAKTCAVEFRSFSKTAGFTGVRCAYAVVPKALIRGGVSLNRLWNRRQAARFNGVSYITQRGAEAVYTPEGRAQLEENLAFYRKNAETLLTGLRRAGLSASGGVDSPYVWVKTPGGKASWEFFDTLLNRAHVVVTPGVGFGQSGEGYIRLTAFSSAEATKEAVERIGTLFSGT